MKVERQSLRLVRSAPRPAFTPAEQRELAAALADVAVRAYLAGIRPPMPVRKVG